MAKRFIDTDYFKSPFVRSLKGALKGLYTFIICDCNGAGIWVKDLDIASIYTGFKISENDWNIFVKSGKAIDLNDGKFFFPDFIEHQYPKGLQENNPAHRNFIEELRKYELLKGASMGLARPFKGSKVKVKVKVKEVVKVKGSGEKSEVALPFLDNEFKKAWQIWKDYKKDEHKFKYKSDHSEKHALAKLNNLADGDIDTALKIIHTSIANGWKGFFALEVEPTNGDEPSMAEQMMKEMKEYRKKQQHEQGN